MSAEFSVLESYEHHLWGLNSSRNWESVNRCDHSALVTDFLRSRSLLMMLKFPVCLLCTSWISVPSCFALFHSNLMNAYKDMELFVGSRHNSLSDICKLLEELLGSWVGRWERSPSRNEPKYCLRAWLWNKSCSRSQGWWIWLILCRARTRLEDVWGLGLLCSHRISSVLYSTRVREVWVREVWVCDLCSLFWGAEGREFN